MSFFDDSHVTGVGLQGSAGPSVGFGEMVSQGFRQQFLVDSARALDDELRNRWLESLRAAQISDQISSAPDPLGRNPRVDPDDPWAYRAFAQHVSGRPVDTFDPNKTLGGYDPTARLKGMIDANEKIKTLNNPDIKSFEQILAEVSEMQRGVEEETASMSERGGGIVPELLGAIGGSFTTRDPLNLITAPVGVGRTVFTRIAAEMGLAAAVVGYTELAEVAPARQIAGLPERNPLYNIGAATIGAGVIRGGIEGIGYGIRRLRSEEIDFDLRDAQLAQMFEANIEKPSARAGLKLLDDTQFIERNNPYGEGRAAQVRFLAELREIQRAMNGEPMTAVARVLPPLPYEYIKTKADFEIVKERAPQVYAKMEAAQARLKEFDVEGAIKSRADMIEKIKTSASKEFLDEIEHYVEGISDREYAYDEISALFDILDRAEANENRSLLKEARQRLIDIGYFRPMGENEIKNTFRSAPGPVWEFQLNKVKYTSDDLVDEWQWPPEVLDKTALVKERRAANAEYQAAYRAVEAEAIRIRDQQTAVEAAQQREAVGILSNATAGRPFNFSALQYDNVQARVDAINAFNDTLDEATIARFTRETVGEGEEAVERETWRTEDGIDIGLKEPVDPEFRISTDDGEISVADAMRDLQDDADLDDAMRTCLL